MAKSPKILILWGAAFPGKDEKQTEIISRKDYTELSKLVIENENLIDIITTK